MTKNRLIATTALITALICVLHFFTAVYVAGTNQSREVSTATLTSYNTAVPYNTEHWQQVVSRWAKPVQPAQQEVSEQDSTALGGYDNARLGDTQVALLAIYRQSQPVAVLALKPLGGPVRYVRLAAQQSEGDINLSQINARDVIITRGTQQVSLRLFNPNSANAG